MGRKYFKWVVEKKDTFSDGLKLNCVAIVKYHTLESEYGVNKHKEH